MKLQALLVILATVVFHGTVNAQPNYHGSLHNTTIKMPCGATCAPVKFQVGHLKTPATYSVSSVPYNPYSYFGGTELTALYADDKYSAAITLPFNVCFYGATYNQMVVGSNGVLTFDVSHEGQANAYALTGSIPSTSGTQNVANSNYFPPSAIFGMYTDLFPTNSGSPTDKRIEWRVEGTAPLRRLIVSYYKIGIYNLNNNPSHSCGLNNPCTFQIVIYETTNFVDVLIGNKACNSSTAGGGKTTLGLQNAARDQAVTAPGKNGQIWNESNTGYRFNPIGTSQFVKSELYTIGGTLINSAILPADTTTTVQGLLDVKFPDLCPTADTTQYYVKTTWRSCGSNATFEVNDTFTVYKNVLEVNESHTNSSCIPNGTITLTPTSGTPPYTYTVNNGTPGTIGNFTNVGAGTYSILVEDAAGCKVLKVVTITAANTLAGTATTTPAACSPTGTITVTVTPGSGTGPYTFSLNNGTPQNSPTFTGVAPGTHNILITDLTTTCTKTVPVTVGNVNTLTGSPVPGSYIPSGCTPTGSFTVSASLGTPPYTYSADGGPSQTSPTFFPVSAGLHQVTITDAATCTFQFNVIVPALPKPTISSAATTNSGCTPNGSVTINLVAGSGVAPMTYVLTPGNVSQSTNVFTGLAPGTYSVTVTDAVGCSVTRNNLVVGAPAPFNATATGTPSGCTASGIVTVTATGGTAPFQYAINGGTAQSSNVFNSLNPGTYNITVTDASGCTATATATVASTASLTATGTSTESGCSPASGTITITVPAGSGAAPYTYKLDGGTPQTSNVFSGVAAGAHSVEVKDAAGCTFIVSVTVGSTPSPTLTLSGTPSGCTPMGTITATVGSGTAPFVFTADSGTPQSSNVFNNLAAGSHTVVVTDSKGCTASLDYTVTTYPALTGTISSTPSGCIPSGTITAAVDAGAGLAPFTFTLDSGTPQSTGIYTGIAPDQHTVVVSDAAGCSISLHTTVAGPPALDGTPVVTASGCTPSGSITINMNNGVAPYTYTLDAGAAQSSNVFTGLASGVHSVVVTDAQGCTATIPATVDAPAPLAGVPATTPSGCIPSGTISITMSNGVAPYSYVLDTGTPQASGSFTNVAAGPHSVVVTDAQGCTTTISALVDATAPLSGSSDVTASGCNPTGSISITMANGVAPFIYVLDSGTPQSSNTFNNVGVGSYSVLVTDAQGCSTTVSATVPALPALTATATTTPSGCSPSGTITVTVPTGIGVAPFQYSVDGGANQSSNVLTGLVQGDHSVTVSDASGCTYTFTATVGNPSPLTATVVTHTTSCDGAANGSAVLQPTNGIAPFQYQIGTSGWQASDSFPNLAVGTYDLSFRDASGCVSGTFQAVITAGPAITATETHTSVSCFGGSNGEATLTLSANATAPFQFSSDNWATSQSSNVLTGLSAGTHTLYFREAAGCANSMSITITEPTQLTAGTPTVVSPLCNGATNGSVTLTATGGTAPYTYSFNNGPFINNATFPSGAGTFNFQMKDANNCTIAVQTVTVTQPSPLVIDSVVTGDASCDTLGRIWAYASGGTAPYQYQLDMGSLQTSHTFQVSPDTYQVSVHDANHCPVQTFVTVGQLNNLTYTRPTVSPICEGSGTTLTPVTNATQFNWSGPRLTPDNAAQSSVTVRPTKDTVYHLVYTLGLCSAFDDIPVSVHPAPVPDAGTGTVICTGATAQLNAASGFAEYKWSPVNYLSDPGATNPTVTGAPAPGVNFFLMVKDGNGCWSLTPDTVRLNVTAPIAVFINPVDTVMYIGDTLHLHTIAAATQYVWTTCLGATPVNLTNPNIADPVLLVEKNECLRVHVTDPNGCTGDGFFNIRAYRGPEIYVPSAFTPNRDGKNDLLRPVCVGINTLSYFRVFDRWGQLMYEYKGEKRGPAVYNLLSSNIGWDGRHKGSDLNTGSFVWIAEGITKEGKVVTRKGVVTIIR